MRGNLFLAAASAALALSAPAGAAVIGRMTPAPPLTRERVSEAPSAARAAWTAYLDRADAARRRNDAALASERLTAPAGPKPPAGDAAASMPLDRPAAWYAAEGARHIADVIVSFQSPAGGWGKNSPRDGAVRVPGQAWSGEETYVGTIDNDATITELRFLARVVTARPSDAAAYRASFVRGVRWLLDAQYPNGGWPQVWPLAGAYHDAVTFNDNAMAAALGLLGDVAPGRGDYAFVEPELRRDAEAAWRRGLAALLAAQTPAGGWPQQADTLTLAPVGARNFEPAALTSAETADILLFLMSLPAPSPEVVRAVHAGAGWLAATPVRDKAWPRAAPSGVRQLIDQPGGPPLWSRYYDLATGRPIFGDRDRTIHDDVEEISAERRNGYNWYSPGPAKALARYEAWSQAHPRR
ncbi:MAG: pectate lyase [Phenylobacterium zucineum]|nr:MAG: pectate lyase [Phenylobacterium zucineum]